MKHLKFVFGVALAISLVSVGCRKEKKTTFDPTEFAQSAEDNARVEGEQNAIQNMVNEQGERPTQRRLGSADSTLLPRCATVSVDTTQRKVVIDFGDTNCLCRDGVYRRGEIHVQFQGPRYPNPGATAVITPVNYFVNDNQHQATKIWTFLGPNAQGENVWRDSVPSASVTTPNGTISWSALRTIKQIQGQNTPRFVLDDIYVIEGGSQGTNRRGTNFTNTITTPLKVVMSCVFRHPVKGVIQHQTPNNTVILNYDPYGNEACDRVASIQVGSNNPVNITLP
ncbi:MAG: hypothetical protein ACUVRD_03850 [Bacteroidia bacterium]